ncbi:MAG: gamma-glutamylcyclotransferase family protein, partial [Desulfurobacteriaceae bacterium]
MFYHLLFVYGTLMRGFSAHAFLLDSDFVSYGVLYGARLLHLEDGYPGAVEGEGEIYGEVYRVDSVTLKALDLFEEFYEERPEDSFYVRKRKFVRLIPYNDFVEVWVYLLNPVRLEALSFTEVP